MGDGLYYLWMVILVSIAVKAWLDPARRRTLLLGAAVLGSAAVLIEGLLRVSYGVSEWPIVILTLGGLTGLILLALILTRPGASDVR